MNQYHNVCHIHLLCLLHALCSSDTVAVKGETTEEVFFNAKLNLFTNLLSYNTSYWRESPSLRKRREIAIERCIPIWAAFLFVAAKAKCHLTKSDLPGNFLITELNNWNRYSYPSSPSLPLSLSLSLSLSSSPSPSPSPSPLAILCPTSHLVLLW